MIKIDNFFLPSNFSEYNKDASKKLKLKNISINRNHMMELILTDERVNKMNTGNGSILIQIK